jgi:hypothetical protein
MRYAARTDANKLAIVSALRAAGATVYDLRQPVDLLVGIGGRTLLIEIKDGTKPPSKRRHTPMQESFLATWRGGAVATIDSVDAALRIIGAMKT